MSNKKKPKKIDAKNDLVKVVVSRLPTGEISIGADIELVKAGLLYGDEVSIVSPAVSMLQRVVEMETWPESQRLDLLERLGPYLGVDLSGMSELATLLHKKHRNSLEIITARKLQHALDTQWFQIGETVTTLVRDKSFDELTVAIQSGLVRVRQVAPGSKIDLIEWFTRSALSAEEGDHLDALNSDIVVETFVDLLAKQLENGDDYLVVDGGIASLIEAMVREGRVFIGTGTKSRNTQAMTASRLLGKLPSFPMASMSEILDIRTLLSASTIRFRSEMVTLSREFEASGYEGGFNADLSDAWTERVLPALQEINDTVEENSLPRLFARSTVGVGAVPGIGIVSYGLGTGNGLVDLVGATAATAGPALQAIWQQRMEHRRIRARPFYFLHLTEQLLGP